MSTKAIGIVGGMGPFAALDVARKLHANTIAKCDREHLNTVTLSLCQDIPDRSEFILGNTSQNPGTALALKLRDYPIDVIGIACNTFHAPEIFNAFRQEIGLKKQIVHLPNAVRDHVVHHYSNSTLTVLSSLGTYESNIYQDLLKDSPVSLRFPDEAGRQALHQAIYHSEWGIKQKGVLTDKARQMIDEQISRLPKADAILLACTELPLILDAMTLDYPAIDINLILARALIKSVAPLKLATNELL